MYHETDVFSELERIRHEMDRLFERLTPTSHRLPVYNHKAFRPPTDVYETEDCIEVRVEVAGMKPDDFQLALTDQTLVITGVRQDSSNKRAYQQMEISWGEFRTEVYLPMAVKTDQITATYQDGFLIVNLPKASSQPRRIEIRPGSHWPE
jgi:HSP20 family protein